MEKIVQKDFTKGNLLKVIILFAMPFLAASFLQSFYGAVDLFVVGQFASDSTSAVSAVSTGSQVMATITYSVLGICTGGTIVMGHAIGNGDKEKTAKTVGALIMLFIIIAAIFTPLMIFGTNLIVTWMQTPEEAVQNARLYIFICSCGLPAIIGYNVVSSIIRGIGDSKTPLIFVLIATVINIALDFAFVKGLGLGTTGAALATVISQFISFIVGVIYIKVKGFPFPFKLKDIRLHKNITGEILKVGFPLALQDFLVNISFLLITASINSLGLICSSAVGVVEKLLGFAFIFPSSFAQSYAVIAAQNIGANLHKRADKCLWISIIISTIFGAVVAIYCNIWPNSLCYIFSNDIDVIKSSGTYLRSYVLDCVLVGLVFNINSYLSCYNKSYLCFIHSMIATFAFRIVLTIVFCKMVVGTNLYIVGFASPISTFFSCIFCTIVYLIMRKKELAKEITLESIEESLPTLNK